MCSIFVNVQKNGKSARINVCLKECCIASETKGNHCASKTLAMAYGKNCGGL